MHLCVSMDNWKHKSRIFPNRLSLIMLYHSPIMATDSLLSLIDQVWVFTADTTRIDKSPWEDERNALKLQSKMPTLLRTNILSSDRSSWLICKPEAAPHVESFK